jgi:hypothetical protein
MSDTPATAIITELHPCRHCGGQCWVTVRSLHLCLRCGALVYIPGMTVLSDLQEELERLGPGVHNALHRLAKLAAKPGSLPF